jgi:YVTN family beta-propeller protein
MFRLSAPLILTVLLAHQAAAAPRIYVSNEDGGDVAVIDSASEAVVSTIAVGKRPRGVKLSPNGKLLYVALSGSPRGGPGVDESKLPPPDRTADGIGVIDLAAGKLLKVLPSGQDPESFDVSPDGKRLYVSNEETAEMSVVDPAAGKVLEHVKIGKEPEGVTIRPGGKQVYVTCEEENEVISIDTRTFKVLAKFETGPRPRSVTFTKNGATAFVSSENGAIITVIDAVKAKVAGEIKIANPTKKPLPPRPMGGVLSPDGKTLYVSLGRNESVAAIDVAGQKVERIFDDVGARPWGIGVSHDGKKLYTANGPSNDVSVVDAATGKVTKRIKAGSLPWGLVVGK